MPAAAAVAAWFSGGVIATVDIDLARYRLEMARVTAVTDAAQVVQVVADWYWTDEQLIDESMQNAGTPVVTAYHAVAAAVLGASPQPAFAALVEA